MSPALSNWVPAHSLRDKQEAMSPYDAALGQEYPHSIETTSQNAALETSQKVPGIFRADAPIHDPSKLLGLSSASHGNNGVDGSTVTRSKVKVTTTLSTSGDACPPHTLSGGRPKNDHVDNMRRGSHPVACRSTIPKRPPRRKPCGKRARGGDAMASSDPVATAVKALTELTKMYKDGSGVAEKDLPASCDRPGDRNETGRTETESGTVLEADDEADAKQQAGGAKQVDDLFGKNNSSLDENEAKDPEIANKLKKLEQILTEPSPETGNNTVSASRTDETVKSRQTQTNKNTNNKTDPAISMDMDTLFTKPTERDVTVNSRQNQTINNTVSTQDETKVKTKSTPLLLEPQNTSLPVTTRGSPEAVTAGPDLAVSEWPETTAIPLPAPVIVNASSPGEDQAVPFEKTVSPPLVNVTDSTSKTLAVSVTTPTSTTASQMPSLSNDSNPSKGDATGTSTAVKLPDIPTGIPGFPSNRTDNGTGTTIGPAVPTRVPSPLLDVVFVGNQGVAPESQLSPVLPQNQTLKNEARRNKTVNETVVAPVPSATTPDPPPAVELPPPLQNPIPTATDTSVNETVTKNETVNGGQVLIPPTPEEPVPLPPPLIDTAGPTVFSAPPTMAVTPKPTSKPTPSSFESDDKLDTTIEGILGLNVTDKPTREPTRAPQVLELPPPVTVAPIVPVNVTRRPTRAPTGEPTDAPSETVFLPPTSQGETKRPTSAPTKKPSQSVVEIAVEEDQQEGLPPPPTKQPTHLPTYYRTWNIVHGELRVWVGILDDGDVTRQNSTHVAMVKALLSELKGLHNGAAPRLAYGPARVPVAAHIGALLQGIWYRLVEPGRKLKPSARVALGEIDKPWERPSVWWSMFLHE